MIEHDVSMRAIRSGWDELIRVAASIETGTISAVLALERFGSAAQGDATHRAGMHLGRLIRTVYLCDYFSHPPGILAHVSPAHFGNVNFRGTFRFPVERYRDRVLGSAARSKLAVVGGRDR